MYGRQETLDVQAARALREALAHIGVAIDVDQSYRLLDALGASRGAGVLGSLLNAADAVRYHGRDPDEVREIEQELGRRLLEKVDESDWPDTVKDHIAAFLRDEIDWTMVLY